MELHFSQIQTLFTLYSLCIWSSHLQSPTTRTHAHAHRRARDAPCLSFISWQPALLHAENLRGLLCTSRSCRVCLRIPSVCAEMWDDTYLCSTPYGFHGDRWLGSLLPADLCQRLNECLLAFQSHSVFALRSWECSLSPPSYLRSSPIPETKRWH